MKTRTANIVIQFLVPDAIELSKLDEQELSVLTAQHFMKLLDQKLTKKEFELRIQQLESQLIESEVEEQTEDEKPTYH